MNRYYSNEIDENGNPVYYTGCAPSVHKGSDNRNFADDCAPSDSSGTVASDSGHGAGNPGHSYKDTEGKPDLRLLADLYPALVEMCHIMKFGAHKYGEGTWRFNDEALYESACMRHMLRAMCNTESDVDEDHGKDHWAAVACNALILLTNKINKGK